MAKSKRACGVIQLRRIGAKTVTRFRDSGVAYLFGFYSLGFFVSECWADSNW